MIDVQGTWKIKQHKLNGRYSKAPSPLRRFATAVQKVTLYA
jgi:hypothetical protein